MTARSRLLTIFMPALLSALKYAAGIMLAGAETLVVTVRDISSSDGDIRISLYNSADNFLVDGQMTATQTRSLPGKAKSSSYSPIWSQGPMLPPRFTIRIAAANLTPIS